MRRHIDTGCFAACFKMFQVNGSELNGHSWVQNFTTPLDLPRLHHCVALLRLVSLLESGLWCCCISLILHDFATIPMVLWTSLNGILWLRRHSDPASQSPAICRCRSVTAMRWHGKIQASMAPLTDPTTYSEIFWAFWSLSQCGWAGMSMNNLWTMLKPWPSNPCSLWVRKVNEPILLAFSRYPMGWTRSPHINHHWLHRVWRWLPVRPDPASGRGGWPGWLQRLTWLQH